MNYEEYKQKTTISHTRTYNKTPLGFVYVPKTAGTYLSMRVLPEIYGNDSKTTPSKTHMPASKVQSIIGDETPLFTVVRNPYDRNCSEYYFLKDKVQASIEYFNWDMTNTKKIKFAASFVSKITESEKFFDKIYNMYTHSMSVEDYLEWCVENPTYPFYFDTKNPKDFDIVGSTEDMTMTTDLLKKMYDVTSGNGDKNENIGKKIKEPYITNYSRKDFENKSIIEYELYYQGINKFNQLCREYL
jgi:hypothetical protein